MPSNVSEPFRLSIVAPARDETVWLGGNGGWADSTFNTLQAIVASIDPVSGGWAEIPNTKLAPVLLTHSEAARIDTRIWQVTGSASALIIWASGAFDGNGFFVGACGGHRAYNGNELYRIRITDPPAAIRMYNPAPLQPGPRSGDIRPLWGPQALHHYDGVHWVPQIGKSVWTGVGRDHLLWSFDHFAPTPQSAWRILSPYDGGPNMGYPTLCMMTDTEIYNWRHLGYSGFVINLINGTRRIPKRPPDPFDSRVGTRWAWGYLRRASTALASKVYFVTQADKDNHYIGSYDPVTGRYSELNAGNHLPAWVTSEPSNAYKTMVLAPGNKCVGWYGTHRVYCYDPATNAMQDFTNPGRPQPVYPDRGGAKGINGRWAYVSATKPGCFVGVNSALQNAWVFRAPASWGIS